MARVVCLSDTISLVRLVREEVAACGHFLFPFPGSRLNEALRQAVRQAEPDIVLLEITNTLDNPHIYFFLRADQTTREAPVILLSRLPDLETLADILNADGFLRIPFDRSTLHRVLSAHLRVPVTVSAPHIAVPRSTAQRYASLMQRPLLMTQSVASMPAV